MPRSRNLPVRALLLASLACLAATPASALTFLMDSGSVEVFLMEGDTELASIGPFALNGEDDFAEFDVAPVGLSDFQFTANDIQDQAITQLFGGGALPGLWGWFNIDIDVVATPGAGYTFGGSDLGGGDYFLTGTNVDLTGTISIDHWDGYSKNVTLTFPTYEADANLLSNVLTLDKISLGGVILTDEHGHDRTIELVADVMFVGTVIPEPGTALLVGLGCGVLALRRRAVR